MNYQILDVLRESEWRAVFQARDDSLGRDVLLVVEKDGADHPDLEARCRRIARIFHPGIVPLLDFGVLPSGGYYTAMPAPAGSVPLPGWIAGATAEPWTLPDRLPRLLEDLTAIEDHLAARDWPLEALDPQDVLLHAEGRASILASGLVRPRAGVLPSGLLGALPAVWRSAIGRALKGSAHPPAAPEAPGLAGSLHESYDLLETLGKGAFGHVVLARQHGLGRRVAIKFLTQALDEDQRVAITRFMQEARTLARLQHPHLVRVFDMGVEAGVAYIVFEYLEGEPLSRKLAREGPVPAVLALPWIDQILDGLGALHEARILHRDVKPSNIMVTGEGIKIIDLGIALVVDQIERLTVDGELMGTPAFCAPEQLLGKIVDETTDLHAVGGILYLALTGRLPFPGPFSEIMGRKLHGEPDPITGRDGVPAPVIAFVRKLLARDPAERYRDVTEVRRDLAAILEPLRPSPTPTPVKRVTRRTANRPAALRTRSSAWLGIGVGAAAACGLVAVGLALRGQDVPRGDAVEVRTPPASATAPGPSSFESMRLVSHGGGDEIRIRSTAPSSCRILGRDLTGKPWISSWSRGATDHRFPLPPEPLRPPIELETETGQDTARIPLDLPADEQRRLWERVILWFETHVTKPVADELDDLDRNTLAINRWMGGASRAEAVQVRQVMEAIRLLGTVGFLGGSKGLLARPEVPLDLKDRFYAALGPVAVASDVLIAMFPTGDRRAVPELTAPGYGPLKQLPPPDVARRTLTLSFVNQNDIFDILPDSEQIEALPELERRPNWTHGILAEVDAGSFDPESVASLVAEGWMPRGTHLSVRVNDLYHVRMTMPGTTGPESSPLGVRFPAALLTKGRNRFYIHMPPLPSFADVQLKLDGTRLVPPGISLCFEPS